MAINHSVPLKIVLFETILGPIKMKVWFGGVGDEFRFQNVQVPNTQIENLGQIPSKIIEKQTFPGWRPAAEEEI